MKTTLAILLLSTSLAGAQDKTGDRLRKGILEEEANHNLEKAIEAYQSIVKQFDEERNTAATALFRLAECYRKQGQTDQAASAYQRVIREFSDQSKLAELSRAQLPKTPGTIRPVGSGERELQDQYPMRQMLDRLRMHVKELESTYTANHPDLLRAKAELRSFEAEFPALEKVASARTTYRSLLDDEIRLVEEQMKGEQRKIDTGVADSDRLTKLKRDVLTLRRALAAIDAGADLPLPALPTRP